MIEARIEPASSSSGFFYSVCYFVLTNRNEKASTAYTTEVISTIIAEEANKRFEARTAIPGHAQQGGTPSPMDRVRATRLAVKCIQFLESTSFDRGPETDKKANASVCVICIRGSKVAFLPARQLEMEETDNENRRPRHAWWLKTKELGDILSGRATGKRDILLHK